MADRTRRRHILIGGPGNDVLYGGGSATRSGSATPQRGDQRRHAPQLVAWPRRDRACTFGLRILHAGWLPASEFFRGAAAHDLRPGHIQSVNWRAPLRLEWQPSRRQRPLRRSPGAHRLERARLPRRLAWSPRLARSTPALVPALWSTLPGRLRGWRPARCARRGVPPRLSPCPRRRIFQRCRLAGAANSRGRSRIQPFTALHECTPFRRRAAYHIYSRQSRDSRLLANWFSGRELSRAPARLAPEGPS